jgi:hypothetical protein
VSVIERGFTFVTWRTGVEGTCNEILVHALHSLLISVTGSNFPLKNSLVDALLQPPRLKSLQQRKLPSLQYPSKIPPALPRLHPHPNLVSHTLWPPNTRPRHPLNTRPSFSNTPWPTHSQPNPSIPSLACQLSFAYTSGLAPYQ